MQVKEDIYYRYKTYLRLEKALSANTIDAYLTDLDKLIRFAESEKKDIRIITYDDLQQFVAQLHDIGIQARSQARIISGINPVRPGFLTTFRNFGLKGGPGRVYCYRMITKSKNRSRQSDEQDRTA